MKMAEVISQRMVFPFFLIAVTEADELPDAARCFNIFLKAGSVISKMSGLSLVSNSFFE